MRNPSNYSDLVEQTSQQHQQSSQQAQGFSGASSNPGQQPSLHDQFKGLQTSLANTIGNAAEAASKAGVPERATQEIVSRAYRQEW
jgi:hypothetical protein